MNNFVEISNENLNEIDGGVNWGTVAKGLGVVAVGAGIVATAGLGGPAVAAGMLTASKVTGAMAGGVWLGDTIF